MAPSRQVPENESDFHTPAICLIGNGRLARHLAHYLKLQGMPFSRWQRPPARVADSLGWVQGQTPVQTTPAATSASPSLKYAVTETVENELEQAVRGAQAVCLAVSDAAIEPLAQQILQFQGMPPLLIHFSGSLSTRLATGIHPLMTFGPDLYAQPLYQSIPMVVEPGQASLFHKFFPSLPNPVLELDPSLKARYHALCVMAGNFTTLLWSKLFQDFPAHLGLPAEIALPYLRQIARNLETDARAVSPEGEPQSPGLNAPPRPPLSQALTGPIARRDLATIERNLKALEGDPYQEIYRAFVNAHAPCLTPSAPPHPNNPIPGADKMTNVLDFKKMKQEGRKISMATCYDYWTARILQMSEVDTLLVGDSLAMVMHGFPSTLHATTEMMALHTAAVARGAPKKFIVADMPFLSNRKGREKALECVEALMKAGAQAVKLEGTRGHEDVIQAIVQSGVPVMGHLGLTPQSIHALGGFRVQGREPEQVTQLKEDARTLQRLGAFAVVLECVPAPAATEISAELAIPTIGIGAGVDTDGQVLVLQDLLGGNSSFRPKFVRSFMNAEETLREAVNQYHQCVLDQSFPADQETYQ